VYKCLHVQAPDYLSELCTPVAQVAERQHLRSASRHLLVSRFQLDTYGRRTFSVAGPTTWNLFQTICISRTYWLFSLHTEDVSFWSVLGTLSALEALFVTMRYINWHLHSQLHFPIELRCIFRCALNRRQLLPRTSKRRSQIACHWQSLTVDNCRRFNAQLKHKSSASWVGFCTVHWDLVILSEGTKLTMNSLETVWQRLLMLWSLKTLWYTIQYDTCI